jgi:hypothetical protein
LVYAMSNSPPVRPGYVPGVRGRGGCRLSPVRPGYVPEVRGYVPDVRG